MPSRRALLATLGLGTASTLSGCSWLDGASGYVQEKSIEVTYREDGRRFGESVVTVSLSSPPGTESPELLRLHDNWANRFETPHKPIVSQALHEDLTREYESVRYVVGVCSPSWAEELRNIGCRNANASREDFNQVQVHDEVTASYESPTISIHSVDGTWPVGEY
ncbi:hypothetical protein ACFPYI_01115 [Halomarina salina]|uniref:Tat pathway signal protein n=1 Tax=Halomarina salina TaxID=1872699 RepID=A0ABD5RHJ4_9EURY|nr:hypothetical protein [Halomarina salina]